MSYSAIHKPSLFERLVGLIGTGLAVALIWWVGFDGVLEARTTDAILWLFAGLLVSLAVGVVVHEAGHFVVGLGLGEPVQKIRIGSGATLVGLRVRVSWSRFAPIRWRAEPSISPPLTAGLEASGSLPWPQDQA